MFSAGRLLLSHIRSKLSAESTHALLCLGAWSVLGFIDNKDIRAISTLPDVPDKRDDEGEFEMEEGWDAILPLSGERSSNDGDIIVLDP